MSHRRRIAGLASLLLATFSPIAAADMDTHDHSGHTGEVDTPRDGELYHVSHHEDGHIHDRRALGEDGVLKADSLSITPLNTGTESGLSGWTYFDDVTGHVGLAYALDTDASEALVDAILEGGYMTWRRQGDDAAGVGLPLEAGVYDMLIAQYSLELEGGISHLYEPSDPERPVFTITVEDHDFSVYNVAQEPTCDDVGWTAHYTCSVCGERDGGYSEIPALEHDWGEWIITVEPTQGTQGRAQRVCENDSEHVQTIELPSLGSGLWTEEERQDPTCDDSGSVRWTYSPSEGGSITFTETLDPLGHDWGEWELVGDTHSRTCSRCGATETSEHNWGQWDVITAPTESSEGLLRRECATEPGHTEDFILPELSEDNGYNLTTSDPDCENPGEKVYTYEKDGQTFTFYADIPATGHQWGDWIITTEPTQNTQGEAQRECENDPSHIDTIELPALGSGLWNETGREDPDCESTGWVEWTYNPSEGGTISFTETLEPLGHDWGNWVSNEDGTHTRVCANDPNHSDTENCSGGSITNFGDGTHGYICSDCGGRYDVSSHAWGDWQIETEPTESQQGTIYRICSDCSAREESTLPALGSGDYSYQVITQPGCETTGLGRYTIQVDDTTLTIDVVIPATGHNYGSWTSNEDGTHSRVCQNDSDHVATDSCTGGNLHDLGDGTHGYTCDVCHDDYNTSAHNYGSDWIADGSDGHYQVCEDCSVHSQVVDHTYGEWQVTTRPTESWAGSMERSCSACSGVQTRELPALNTEDYELIVEIAPTCTVNGSGYYRMSIDGQTFSFSVSIAATGHDFSQYVSDNNATCYQDGTETATCRNGCGNTLTRTETGSMKDHEWEYAYDENTHVYTCIWGGETQGSEEAHTFGDWQVILEATQTDEGLQELHCLVCDYYVTEVIPVLPPPSYTGHIVGIAILALACALVGGYLIYLAVGYAREGSYLK